MISLRAKAVFLVSLFVTWCSAGSFPVNHKPAVVRGDDAPLRDDGLARAEAQIQRYFESSETSRKFSIQGWRWHTMSLIREARRLHQLAVQLEDVDNSSDLPAGLKTFADYTVHFNMRGLHRIEKDLFFPWVRSKTKNVPDKDVAGAFDAILDHLERDRQRLETLGVSLVRMADLNPRRKINDCCRRVLL